MLGEESTIGAANWAVNEIITFIQQEERRGAEVAEQVEHDPSFRPLLAGERNVFTADHGARIRRRTAQ